jgi:hypothetical protein
MTGSAAADESQGINPKIWRVVVYGGMGLLLVVLTACFGLTGCSEMQGIRRWMELMNGATWPDQPAALCDSKPWLFSFFLALRTMLNLGSVFAAVVVVLELFIFRRKKIMNVRQLLKSRELAALQAVELALSSSPPETREAALAAVKNAGKDWDNDYLPTILGTDEAEDVLGHVIRHRGRGHSASV